MVYLDFALDLDLVLDFMVSFKYMVFGKLIRLHSEMLHGHLFCVTRITTMVYLDFALDLSLMVDFMVDLMIHFMVNLIIHLKV